MEFVGRIVRKEFEGLGFCSGTVRSCKSSPGFFEIVYDNGFSEVLDLAEVVALAAGGGKAEEETIRVKPRVGRKPKKRRRIAIVNEVRGGSCGNGDGQEENEVKSVKIFDLNNGFAWNSRVIDDREVNLSRNVDLNRGCDETQGGKCGSEMGLNGGVCNLRNGIDFKADLDLDLDLNEGLDSGDLINVNVDYEENFGDKRRGYIDLNMDANCDLDELCGSGSHVQKRDRGFDLNLDVDVENSRDDMNMGLNGHDRAQETSKQNGIHLQKDTETGELREVHIAEVSSAQSIEKIWKQNSVSGQEFYTPNGVKQKDDLSELDAKALDGSQSDREHLYEHGSGRKKRRKVLDNSNFVTETVLRRSTRKTSSRTRVTSSATTYLADQISPSPAVSGLTEEKTLITVSQGAEEPALLPPKPQLPPSDNLRLDGLPLLDIFSVYACLRSFSTLLFLSPFELEEFVEALKCMTPNLLFDSIHVSLLQILRKHLVRLSSEGDPSASDCLRSLDWDTLDVVTYPLFVVEYLLFHWSDHNPGLDLGRLKLFRSEYFKQPVTLKIDILRRLCDDMIDVEAVRLEINRRSLAPEFGMEFDRNMNTEVGRKKQALVEMEDDSSINDEVIGDSSDWNSDECCLCKMDGNLLCCDGCPAAYHSKCVGVASHLLSEGEWYCPECAFDRLKPGLKPGKLLRGAEFLETDPHGRQYYSSCGYLLVIDTDGSESLNYYHMNDLADVLEGLKSCGKIYGSVINVINKHWEIPVGLRGKVSNMNSQMSVCLDPSAKGLITSTNGFKTPPQASEASMLETEAAIEGKVDETSIAGCLNKHCRKTSRKTLNSAAGLDIQNKSSEGSAESVQDVSGIHIFHNEAPSSTLDTKKESNANFHVPTHDSPRISTRKGAKSKVQSDIGYRNCYSFARITSLIAEDMMRKSLVRANEVKSDEDIISSQVKTILMKSNKFHWRSIQSMYLDSWKEKCGWCYSCKNPSEDIGNEMECLFNMGLGLVRGLPESEILSIRSNSNQGHLLAVMCQVISIESRLQGLLVGPWLDPQYSRIWRESILKASNISSLKRLLLKLEANLHHRVLSSEWLNHVDSAISMGSSVHIVIASTRSYSKSAIDKQRGRLLESGVKPTTKKKSGLTMCWWRGGRLSRQLFNWKVLPRSLVSKAARQAGHMKIPGVLYPESSELPRRSRHVAWQAAVESSTSSEQLGLQVREFDSYVKWDDVESTHLLPALDKEARKSIRLFKKAIVRRKCLEGGNVKYLLDFGKRRNIPEIVLKNGSMVEESSSGRKKFWVNESCVPLHLLKGFEEKRIARKTGKMVSSRLTEAEKVRKRLTKEKGFSYLFMRAERSESTRCGHCSKGVLLSEAVHCYICQGFFHQKHVRNADNDNKECSYICHRCRDGMLAKEQPKVRKRGRPPGSTRKSFGLQTQKHKKVTPARKSARVKKMKASLAEKMSLKLQNHKKVVVAIPLRRSARRSQPMWKQLDQIQNKSTGGNKKQKQKSKRGRGRPRKVKQEISWRKKRTRMFFSYWSNGLLLSRKPSDERVLKFRRDRFVVPSENLESDHDHPKCHLCASAESASAFIACEVCGEWFHGDAFGLCDKNIDMLIGFRCHVCRKRSSPICPHTQSTSTYVSQVPESLMIDHPTEDE